MARQKKKTDKADQNVVDYRHKSVKRLNIPPAGLTARGDIVREKKVRYAYNPHLSPALRFDATGKADSIEKLIKDASRRKLEPHEIKLLQEALRNHEPWLEWAGKREQQWCVADPVALHIHERISTQAVLRVAKREDVQRSLFADPEQEYREAVQFYKHPMDWTNRMILGDSLSVIASLARREALAGKVQMIYMDPPYGIKYASNFQPEVGRRDVKDKDEDLTREPEMVKAYRDTWTLGVHSYLSYLRDRVLLCKELLADTGSIFVQISDENLHRVRSLLDEVFGPANYCSVINFRKTTGATSALLPTDCDFILWYAKDIGKVKFRQINVLRTLGQEGAKYYEWIQSKESGEQRRLSSAEEQRSDDSWSIYSLNDMTSQTPSDSITFDYPFKDRTFNPGTRGWRTTIEGMKRLSKANRLQVGGTTLRYKVFFSDFGCALLTSSWDDTRFGGFVGEGKVYVVQTQNQIIERCLLMTTDPGDLVLDPTGGSGTTAFVAEEWGRRWISIDVSRVAIAIARQRLLTAKFDYYKLRPTSAEDVQRNSNGPWLTDPASNIQGTCTFDCKTVPHSTLKSIAQNQALDPIFEKYEPVLAEKLAGLNKALSKTVTKDLRKKLLLKLQEKIQSEGKKSITDADERRWKLPEKEWKDWEVPFDTDTDWPKELQESLIEYRKAWRQKMDEVNACISARADQEELVDQLFADRSKVRVYDDLVFAAFSFTGEAQVTIQDVQDPDIKLHMAQIRPDVNMGDLLKTTVSSQLFTVSGSPRTKIDPQADGQFTVHMEGVDIYDPVTNSVRSTGAEKVAAWFLDSDYDGRCFCVCQAFFPDKSAWQRLGKALGGTLDPEAFARLSGTVSLPFPTGPHKRIAVKVIDPRGNEVMRVHKIGGNYD
jgi:adenine-specific DNA-methyltransferase